MPLLSLQLVVVEQEFRITRKSLSAVTQRADVCTSIAVVLSASPSWVMRTEVLVSLAMFSWGSRGVAAAMLVPVEARLGRSVLLGSVGVDIDGAHDVCRVLSCTVVYCRVLSCTVVYCRVLSCTVVYCRVVLTGAGGAACGDSSPRSRGNREGAGH
jgi:hypothetical protein